MNTAQRTICSITNEVPLFNNSRDTDKGRQISKEKQHQICLNLVFMLGISQGIKEEEISKILSLNLKAIDSFENIVGTILDKMVKYKSNENEKFQPPNKENQLYSSKSVGESSVLPLVMYESDYDVKISDEKTIIDSDVESMDISDGENTLISQDTEVEEEEYIFEEDIVELDESFLIEKESKGDLLVNTEYSCKEKRKLRIYNSTEAENAERLIITNDDDPPRFKLFCGYLKTKEFKNHAISLRLPPLPEIHDINIRRIAKGRNKYKVQWDRYKFLGDRVCKLYIPKIVLKYFKTIFNHSLENVVDFLNSNKLFAAYCMCLNLHEDNHIPQDAHYITYADAFKAYFGGLYLDQGEDYLTEYLTELLMPLLCNLANYQPKIKPHIFCESLGKIAGEYFEMEWLI
ncbi:hypothetical protein C1645_818767 [Glomus cerebriforme]|uniref:RNase III domain-containing protein n=1 Tax=Glomus cerebriforme TaxID=658196 RepID=A0A397T6T3_9GLOM|nr:hypothetical protein C1645_818767 [Glomus cerebriforme]